jgi:hypothetical protein
MVDEEEFGSSVVIPCSSSVCFLDAKAVCSHDCWVQRRRIEEYKKQKREKEKEGEESETGTGTDTDTDTDTLTFIV